MKTRIAPTPSGHLHIGNALSFAITAAIAKRKNAELLLRVDDLDQERVRTEYVDDVFETLNQLGITYSEGPRDLVDLERNWSQFHRVDEYNSTIDQLAKAGHLYSCGCSRKDLNGLSPNSLEHDCRKRVELAIDQPFRIRLPEPCIINFKDELRGTVSVDLNTEMPDFIIRRRDRLPSYQIASLTDDILFGIDLIIRGEDLLASTAAQIYLAEILGLDEFLNSTFYHHMLVSASDGTKLSKSDGAESLKSLRESGTDTKMVLGKLSAIVGMEPKSQDIQSFGAYLNIDLLKSG